jgi:Cu(I)/Ag(I) efflux system membrane fusion protein
VSEHAVIPTGRRDIVVLSHGGGRFSLREVSIGRRWLTASEPVAESRGLSFFTGHHRFHEVLSGLTEGEEVVTNGAFLLHAETQIRNLVFKMAPETEVAALKTALPSELAPHIHALFESYLALGQALSGAGGESTDGPAEALHAATSKLRTSMESLSDPTLQARVSELVEAIEPASKLLQAKPSEKEKMKLFGVMSLALEKYSDVFGPPGEGPIYQFYCGMAKRAVESPTERWFQRDAQLRNPYGMPGCGQLERTLP